MQRNGFGPRLKQLIKQKQFTQAQVAAAIGTSVPSVNRWTKGGEIEYENLRTLADFLDVNWVWLRYGDEAIESLQSIAPENSLMVDMRQEYLQQILDNETRMKLALEMAHIINWEWNILTGVVTFSDNAADVFGCDPKLAEASMLPFSKLELDALIQLFNTDVPHYWDFAINLNDGNTRWFSGRGKLVYDSLQRPTKVTGVTADITAKKIADLALEHSEKMMRKILDIVPVGFCVADKTGKIYLTNPELKRIWGGVKHVDLDNYDEYKGWWEKDGRELGSEGWALARAATKGEIIPPEVVNIEAFDGTHRTIVMFATPLYDADGNLTGAIEINQDISDIKKTEHQLQFHLTQWQSLFEQALFDMIQLDSELKVENISKNLVNQHDGRTQPDLDSLLEAATKADILEKIQSHTQQDVVAFLTTGKLRNNDQAQRFYVIHDNRVANHSMTLIFNFREHIANLYRD